MTHMYLICVPEGISNRDVEDLAMDSSSIIPFPIREI